MADENPIRTLGDYSKPSHKGYRNTIELPVGSNVDFLKLMDSLDLDGENRERTCLRLFQFSLRDQVSNWLKSLPAGSITTWEDLTTRFLVHLFQSGRIAKLRNDILIRAIDQSSGGKLRDLNAEESWALLEDLALYNNESRNDPRDFAKPVKAIALPQDVPSTSDRRLIELETQVQHLMEAHLTLTQPTQVNKITTSCEIYNGPHDTLCCIENPNKPLLTTHPRLSIKHEAITERIASTLPSDTVKNLKLEETDHIFGLADGIKSYPVGIVKDVEVHIGKLKLLNDFYVIDMKKDPETSLLVGRGFLAITNAVIDYRMAKIVESYKPRPRSEGVGAQTLYYARKDFLDFHLPREWEISRYVMLNPFKDTLVFRRMGKPPKNEDGAWHAKIRLIDPDGEEFTKTLQSIPIIRKLSEKESPRDIIDWDHFYVT
nr:MAK10-like protein [Tanacetum cinerariifolium]